jgi:hypothetical protein
LPLLLGSNASEPLFEPRSLLQRFRIVKSKADKRNVLPINGRKLVHGATPHPIPGLITA